MNTTWGVILLCLIALTIATCGCLQHADGGASRQDLIESETTFNARTGAVTFKEHREGVATTQPSSETWGTTPEIGGSDGPGEIGSLKFKQMKPPSTGNIVLGCICLLAAGLSYYFTRNLIVAGVALAVGIAAFVLPTVLGIVAVGALVIIVLSHFGFSLKRIIGSVSFGMKKLEAPDRENLKDAMQQKQSPADVAAINALKPAA